MYVCEKLSVGILFLDLSFPPKTKKNVFFLGSAENFHFVVLKRDQLEKSNNCLLRSV